MTSHVDAETLALSAEGLLEGNEESVVQQHVADCTACAAQQSDLADVSQALAEVSAPPLPDSIAERLDDALRAEAANPASDGRSEDAGEAQDGGTGSGPPGSVVPMRRRFGSSHRWINYLAVAAAAVVVVGGGSAVVRNLAVGPAGGEQLSAPGGGAADSSAHDSALSYQPLIVESGTVYTSDRLGEQSAAVLDGSDPTASGGSQGDAGGSAQDGRSGSSTMPSDVASCVQSRAGGSGDHPLLIDLAEYSSGGTQSDAWVMYYGSRPGGQAQDSYKVVVLSPDCGAENAAAEDAVLARTTVPAP
ncbi:hypothetical protein ACFQZ2_02555 [Streptomonospora algeriensis]|uniref:Zinc-finger domain-containing protein n=1 Tax=Streptomonospora algeriensis TaxID=995084 RepID=A0ABW3B8N5_9ACTN